MLGTEFVVVDVETSLGDPVRGRIIEMAVIAHDGLLEIERWNSLIKQPDEIPVFIQRLTGIRPAMLRSAPPFLEVARKLRASTQDRIMVAHNVRFDMTAIQHEFARTGLSYHPDTLCTERLTRQLHPQLPHYNLASLCRYFGIAQGHKHRAAHDAQATLSLFLHLIGEHGSERVFQTVVPWSEQRRA